MCEMGVTGGKTCCVGSWSGTVTVDALPTVSVNSPTICVGGSTTLTATTSAATPSYLWSPGGATTASITVNPAATTTYTVTVTDGTTSCRSGEHTSELQSRQSPVCRLLPAISVGGTTTLTATTSAA